MDVWDGVEEPVVYHGRTLTTRLPVREALAAIAKYAFIASPYPVILSMEVHCDHSQQDKLAEILKTTLGKALVNAPLFGEELSEEHAGCPVVKILPSPEDLKYRVLVKAKNLYVVKAAANAGEMPVGESEESEESSSTSSDSELKRGESAQTLLNLSLHADLEICCSSPVLSTAMRMILPSPSPPLPPPLRPPTSPVKQVAFNFGPVGGATSPKQSKYAFSSTSNPNPAPERQQPSLNATTSSITKEGRRMSLTRLRSRSEPSSSNVVASEKKEKTLMSLALAGLIIYTVGVKWRGLNKKEQYGASHVISLGERRATKLIKEARNDLVAHNRTHLVRCYPAGTRFTSSNYLPQPFWAVGIQMVALNWQTYDLASELNTALFQRNGRSGYVLKPELLRMKRSVEKDKEVLGKEERYTLVVEVLSAQQLPRPREDELGFDDFTGGNSSGAVTSASTHSSSSSISAAKNVSLNPFVEVAVYTPTAQPGERTRFKTPVVIANGFNPVFNSKFSIPFTVPPDMLDLAFLRLEVMVKYGGDELSLGKYTVSLPLLMPGESVAVYMGDIRTAERRRSLRVPPCSFVRPPGAAVPFFVPVHLHATTSQSSRASMSCISILFVISLPKAKLNLCNCNRDVHVQMRGPTLNP